MTIKNITKIKNFGIFKDQKNTNLKDFGKYNLLYGWNGSGKSTLSYLFHCLENRLSPDKFPSSEFHINLEGNTSITQQNISDANLNICTFNNDFIEKNISWNSIVNSILLVDEKMIEDREKLEKLKIEQATNDSKYSQEKIAIEDLKREISKFSTVVRKE